MDVVGRAGNQLRQDPDALADGVAMRELVEGAVSALHQLGNDPHSADLMLHDYPFLDMLIKVRHIFLKTLGFYGLLFIFCSGCFTYTVRGIFAAVDFGHFSSIYKFNLSLIRKKF